MTPYLDADGVTLYHGDCRDVMRHLPADSVDAIVTDPPYGLSKEPDVAEVMRHWLAGTPYTHGSAGFMGKTWDSFVPGPEYWRECYRVLKPGAHALVFAGTRTAHLMTMALCFADFEVRDTVQWIYGSGFPKSHDIGKSLAKMGEAELAKKWAGWGTALKPAHEPIMLVRKPHTSPTIAENIRDNGIGGLNAGGCKILREPGDVSGWSQSGSKESANRAMSGKNYTRDPKPDADGRWPANVIHDGSPEVLAPFPTTTSGKLLPHHKTGTVSTAAGIIPRKEYTGEWGGDSGSAARFFYCAKAAKSERGETNDHPTVKPLALMSYLVKLITPDGGLVLDPFLGSGSTVLAARAGGWKCIGIEQDAAYLQIVRSRLAA